MSWHKEEDAEGGSGERMLTLLCRDGLEIDKWREVRAFILGTRAQRQALGHTYYLRNVKVITNDRKGNQDCAWGLAILNCFQGISWQIEGPWKAEEQVVRFVRTKTDVKCWLDLVTRFRVVV